MSMATYDIGKSDNTLKRGGENSMADDNKGRGWFGDKKGHQKAGEQSPTKFEEGSEKAREAGKKGGEAAQRSGNAHQLTTEERAKGGENSQEGRSGEE
jgi:hypothetical protein